MKNYTELFNDSLARATAVSEYEFYECFYRNFLDASPEVAERFRNTDLNAQRRMLAESMAFMIAFAANHVADPYMEVLSRRHGPSDLAIPTRLFDLWLDSLVTTAGELDPRFDGDTDVAWRVTLAPGLAFMKAAHTRGA